MIVIPHPFSSLSPTMSRTKEKEKDKGSHSKLTKPPPSCNVNVATDEPKALKKGINYIAQVHNKDPKERKEPVVAQILRAFYFATIKHSAKKGPWSGANVKDNHEWLQSQHHQAGQGVQKDGDAKQQGNERVEFWACREGRRNARARTGFQSWRYVALAHFENR